MCGGASMEEVRARAVTALETACRAAPDNGRPVVAVTHGGVLGQVRGRSSSYLVSAGPLGYGSAGWSSHQPHCPWSLTHGGGARPAAAARHPMRASARRGAEPPTCVPPGWPESRDWAPCFRLGIPNRGLSLTDY